MSARAPLRLAVVEDSDEDFLVLRRALAGTRFGERVQRFRSAREALHGLGEAATSGGAPALVLLDLNLPDQLGQEMLAALKLDPVTRGMPVMILSGSDRPQDVEDAYRTGAAAYIVKPLDFHSLHRTMRALGEFWGCVALPGDHRDRVHDALGDRR